MGVFKKLCLRCLQEVSTDDNGRVGFHTVAASSGRGARKCPGQGS